MDPDIKHKIDALLHELRSWEPGEERHTVQELAEKFDLTTFVVARIAAAEDIDVPIAPEPADPEAETQPVEVDTEATTSPTGTFRREDLDLDD